MIHRGSFRILPGSTPHLPYSLHSLRTRAHYHPLCLCACGGSKLKSLCFQSRHLTSSLQALKLFYRISRAGKTFKKYLKDWQPNVRKTLESHEIWHFQVEGFSMAPYKAGLQTPLERHGKCRLPIPSPNHIVWAYTANQTFLYSEKEIHVSKIFTSGFTKLSGSIDL